ncbi:substrate-binding periplasmic protein [Thalassotalea fusca]
MYYFSSVGHTESDELITYLEQIPPYTCLDNKQATGIAVEIIQHLAKHTNYDVSFEMVPWARAMSEARTRENVLLAVLNRTNKRESNFHWFFQLDQIGAHYWLWRLKDSTLENVTNTSELHGKRFAYTRSSILLENFQDFLQKNNIAVSMYEVSNLEQAIKMLIAKRVDYISAGEEEIFLELAKYGIPKDSLYQSSLKYDLISISKK